MLQTAAVTVVGIDFCSTALSMRTRYIDRGAHRTDQRRASKCTPAAAVGAGRGRGPGWLCHLAVAVPPAAAAAAIDGVSGSVNSEVEAKFQAVPLLSAAPLCALAALQLLKQGALLVASNPRDDDGEDDGVSTVILPRCAAEMAHAPAAQGASAVARRPPARPPLPSRRHLTPEGSNCTGRPIYMARVHDVRTAGECGDSGAAAPEALSGYRPITNANV